MTSNPQPDQPDELRRVLQEAERTSKKSIGRDVTVREDAARVTINLWQQLIPRESVDPAVLLEAVQQELGAVLDTTNLVQRIPLEARAGLTRPALLSHALQDDDAIVRFTGGYLTIPESRRVTKIRDLVISEQNLSATVTGSTTEAEYCVRQLAMLMNRAAGIQRVWSDFEPHIEMTAYLTSTVADLDASLMHMLSSRVQRFFMESVGGEGDSFGKRMGGWDAVSSNLKADLLVVPAVKRIEFVVGIMDRISGRYESCDIDVLAHTKGDYNRARVKLTTELRSTDHHEFTEQLVAAMKAGAQT